MHSDLETVCQFFQALIEFSRPTLPTVSNVSSFFRQIVSRSEFFVHMDVPDTGKGPFLQRAKTVRGRAALEMMYHDFTSPNPKMEDYAKWLRAYGWLLTSGQRDAVDDLLKRFIRDHRATLVTTKSIVDGPVDSVVPTGGSAASSSAIVASSVLPRGIDSKSCGSEGSVVEPPARKEARAHLLSVLRGKAKRV